MEVGVHAEQFKNNINSRWLDKEMNNVAGNNPKYSIILPARNGFNYLPTCINTIIDQNYNDYELIISDDHSNDGTKQYLNNLSHPNIITIEPPEELSMSEHWEWALTHARGEWIIFVGQDDGLQPYFFQLSDRLIEMAESKKLRVIVSARAHYFWKGCNLAYGDIAVSYGAVNKIKIFNSKVEALKALLGIQNYFELPQMYTTSICKKNLLEEAAAKQGGKVFLAHPQDANLAVIACSLDKNYLKTFIPLGWVGSSPKSAGMAINFGAGKKQKDSEGLSVLAAIKNEYEEKVANSKYKYPDYAGDFSFGDASIYFWQALLQTQSLRSIALNRMLGSHFFKVILFGCILIRMIRQKKLSSHQAMFMEILERNRCNYIIVYIVSLFALMGALIWKTLNLCTRVVNKIKHISFGTKVTHTANWLDNQDMHMMQASNIVMNLLVCKKWIKADE